jgi:CBS-domain-containing membrane protein
VTCHSRPLCASCVAVFTSPTSEIIAVALQHLGDHECHTMPVVRRDRVIGLVTMDNVGEFLRMQAVRQVVGGLAAPCRPLSRPHIHTETS